MFASCGNCVYSLFSSSFRFFSSSYAHRFEIPRLLDYTPYQSSVFPSSTRFCHGMSHHVARFSSSVAAVGFAGHANTESDANKEKKVFDWYKINPRDCSNQKYTFQIKDIPGEM